MFGVAFHIEVDGDRCCSVGFVHCFCIEEVHKRVGFVGVLFHCVHNAAVVVDR